MMGQGDPDRTTFGGEVVGDKRVLTYTLEISREIPSSEEA
jgi:hypothetical protein